MLRARSSSSLDTMPEGSENMTTDKGVSHHDDT
jgi:hypothetical protein